MTIGAREKASVLAKFRILKEQLTHNIHFSKKTAVSGKTFNIDIFVSKYVFDHSKSIPIKKNSKNFRFFGLKQGCGRPKFLTASASASASIVNLQRPRPRQRPALPRPLKTYSVRRPKNSKISRIWFLGVLGASTFWVSFRKFQLPVYSRLLNFQKFSKSPDNSNPLFIRHPRGTLFKILVVPKQHQIAHLEANTGVNILHKAPRNLGE